MKVLEHVEEGLIRQRVEIDEMQCGFVLGCGTTDALFMVRQLHEKHLIANKPLYVAFVYLEKKAFDCNLVFELVSIRALSLAHYSSSLC